MTAPVCVSVCDYAWCVSSTNLITCQHVLESDRSSSHTPQVERLEVCVCEGRDEEHILYWSTECFHCVCVCLGTQLCRGQEWLLLDNMHYSQYAHAGRQFSLLMSCKYAHNKLRGFSKEPQNCGFQRMDKDGKHLCSQTNTDSNCMGCMWRIHLIFMLF